MIIISVIEASPSGLQLQMDRWTEVSMYCVCMYCTVQVGPKGQLLSVSRWSRLGNSPSQSRLQSRTLLHFCPSTYPLIAASLHKHCERLGELIMKYISHWYCN